MTRTGRPPKLFWEYVEKTDGCWLWQGVRNPEGYGMFVRTVRGTRRYTMAHRHAHLLAKGPIPYGWVIDHLCRNTSCVNPDHLEAVTQRENSLRGNGLAARNASKTHCDFGHPLVWHKNRAEGRYCLTCRRAYDAAYQRRRRAEQGDHINALRRAKDAEKRALRSGSGSPVVAVPHNERRTA